MTFRMIRWEPCVLLLAAVIGTSMAGACRRGDSPPQAPYLAPSTTAVRVTGTEKVAWDQAAKDATQLARYRYIVFIDDVPEDLIGATCDSTSSPNRTFPCSATLPKMSPGLHRFQLAAQTTDGEWRSEKSGAIMLDVTASKTP